MNDEQIISDIDDIIRKLEKLRNQIDLRNTRKYNIEVRNSSFILRGKEKRSEIPQFADEHQGISD